MSEVMLAACCILNGLADSLSHRSDPLVRYAVDRTWSTAVRCQSLRETSGRGWISVVSLKEARV